MTLWMCKQIRRMKHDETPPTKIVDFSMISEVKIWARRVSFRAKELYGDGHEKYITSRCSEFRSTKLVGVMSLIICYCWWYCWWFRNPVKSGWFDLVNIYIYVNLQFVRYHYSVQGFIHVRCFAEVLLLQGLDLGRGVNCQSSMECFIRESTSGS